MRKEKSCGCIVFNKNKEILLVKMNLGHWSFPKGHVEPGETEYDTAYRETKEETDIDCVIVDGFRFVSSYSPYKGVLKDVIFFIGIAKTDTPKRQVEEIAKVDFYTYDEAEELLTFKTDKEILKEAMNFIGKHDVFKQFE